jgi:CBS domain-containing protein
MSVAQILKNKTQETYTCGKEWTVLKCIHLMNEKMVGSLLVTDEAMQIEGIITERDVLHLIEEHNCIPDGAVVGDIMTGKDSLVVADTETPVEKVMEMMTSHHIRHVPVVDHDILVGIVSIRDAVKYMLDMALFESESVRHCITGKST